MASLEGLKTLDNLPMRHPVREAILLCFESGDGKNVASANLDDPLFRF
jgi:hypothetical protein